MKLPTTLKDCLNLPTTCTWQFVVVWLLLLHSGCTCFTVNLYSRRIDWIADRELHLDRFYNPRWDLTQYRGDRCCGPIEVMQPYCPVTPHYVAPSVQDPGTERLPQIDGVEPDVVPAPPAEPLKEAILPPLLPAVGKLPLPVSTQDVSVGRESLTEQPDVAAAPTVDVSGTPFNADPLPLEEFLERESAAANDFRWAKNLNTEQEQLVQEPQPVTNHEVQVTGNLSQQVISGFDAAELPAVENAVHTDSSSTGEIPVRRSRASVPPAPFPEEKTAESAAIKHLEPSLPRTTTPSKPSRVMAPLGVTPPPFHRTHQ